MHTDLFLSQSQRLEEKQIIQNTFNHVNWTYNFSKNHETCMYNSQVSINNIILNISQMKRNNMKMTSGGMYGQSNVRISW